MPRTTTPVAIFIALAMILPVALAATTFRVEITNANASPAHTMRAFDTPGTALGDFNKDGKPEIVGQNENQYVYVMSTTDSRILAEFRPDYPSNWGVRPINDPAVADVDNDGNLDIIVVTSAGHVCVYEYKGGTSTKFNFERQWCKRMDAFDGSGTAADGGAWVEDVTGDGKKEIFAQTEKVGLYAFNWDGSVRWAKNKPGGNSGPLVSDIDHDGKKEVIFFGDGGEVVALDASSGNTKWSHWAGALVRPASIPVAGNVGDIDGDGKEETIFVARDAHDSNNYYNNHFMLIVLDHNGRVQWTRQPSWGNPMSYTHPAIVDVNGDGKKDIVLMDWNTIGHKPGNWEKLGPANVFVYNGFGDLLWRTTVDNSWSNDDLAVADVDGDGKLEVLAIGFASSGADGVWYLDARTGAKETHVPVGPWTALRGPVLGNLDGSGKMGWAISINTGSKGGGYRVYNTDASCRETGFLGWQNNYGCDGSTGGGGSTPPPPPPPPSSDFDADFTPTTGNNWWIQVKVAGNQGIRGVDVQINSGSWQALDLKSWGDWAKSIHVPDGSTIKFRATSTSGSTDTSDSYTWPPGSSGGGGSFSATYEPANGNAWWIQVKVTSSASITGVDVSVNGGPWQALDLKSWGDWAKSIHVPDGSTIKFRATSTSGSTDTSGDYTWPPGSSGGGGSFSATYQPSNGNAWWIQVKVTSSASITGVDARVNGGSWQALEHKSWGDWAKSIHAPSGSTVEFRAHAGSATHVSGKFTWPAG